MEVPSKTSLHAQSRPPMKRAKWRWRIFYLNIWLLAVFLVVSIFGLGVLALVAGMEEELEWGERALTLGLGGAIMVAGLAIVKSIFPEISNAEPYQKKR